MMRFLCPHCRHVLELEQPTPMLLCPNCELWCRIPIPSESPPPPPPPPSSPRAVEPIHAVSDEPRLAPSEPLAPPRRDALTDNPIHVLPMRLLDQTEDVEDVDFEVVEDGTRRRRKIHRKRRRYRRGGFDLDYWISPTLILMLLLIPGGVLLIIVAFLYHPGAGFGALFMIGGGIWFTLIAAEDGLSTALAVLFVPFYAWYYAFANYERVIIPLALYVLGTIVLTVTLVMAGLRARESSALPAPHFNRGPSLAGDLSSRGCGSPS